MKSERQIIFYENHFTDFYLNQSEKIQEKIEYVFMIIKNVQNIPKKFLEQILLEMRNAGFLYSKKGAGGGYSLLKNPEEINLVQVMRLTGGPIAQLPCVSLNFYQRCEECKEEETCGIRNTFMSVRDATLKILSETTIADLIKKEKNLADLK